MLRGIMSTSLQFRHLVLVFAMVLLVLGITRLGEMPVDVLPEFSPTYVEIQTEALGLSTEEVEQLITVPLEQDLLNGVAWLDIIRSESVPGLSSVVLIFEPGTDLYQARQMVAERLSQAAVGLPHVSKSPTMLQPTSSTGRVMIVGLSSKTLSLIEMSVLARWTIVPRLMGVPGVSNVAVWGMRDWQLQVQVDPERLRAHNVSLLQVLETTGNALWVSTLSFIEASTPGNAGFIDTPQQRLGIQHILPIISPDRLAQVPVQDSTVRLIDVANVVESHQPLIGDAQTSRGTGLLLVIEKFPGANTLNVTRDVEQALGALQPGLPGMEVDSTIFRPATFIQMAMDNLTGAMVIGFVLLILVLGALFLDWRPVLTGAAAIALSLASAGLVLYGRGATLNVMVLAGLVIAIGVIVDDAIVDVQNILRRLRQGRSQGTDKLSVSLLLEWATETRGTLLLATLVCLLAALPIFSLDGIRGAFFQPLVVSYMLAVIASMVVALTVTPVLSIILLSSAPAERPKSLLAAWLERGYEGAAASILGRPLGALLIAAILAVLGLGSLPFLRQDLVPTFREPDVLIRLDAAPGTSHPEMVRIVDQMSRELRSIPGVRNIGAHVGRAVFGDQVVGINSAELWVNVDPAADYDQTVAAINNAANDYPGIEYKVQRFLDQVSADAMVRTDDSIVVRVFGHDWAVLRNEAEKVKQALSGTNGLENLHVNLPVEEPTFKVKVDLAAAQRHGLKPGDVRRAAAVILNGLQVGNLFQEQKVFDVVVWSTPGTRTSLTSIRDLLVDTPDGGHVRLGDVAQVTMEPTANDIKHEAVSRYLDVVATVRGRDMNSVAADVRGRLQPLRFPLEYHAELQNDYAQQEAARNRLLGFAIVAAVGILLLLQAAFGGWRLAIASFLTLPLALVGGLLAVLATGGVLLLGSLIGFLGVFGIAARNQIMLVHQFQTLQHHEGEQFGPELILRGTRERLGPILMSGFATAVWFMPFLLLVNAPGLEILRPMAIVVLGGLVSVALLNLFVTPALYLKFGAGTQTEESSALLSAEPA